MSALLRRDQSLLPPRRVRTQRAGGRRQTGRRVLTRKRIGRSPDPGLPASGTVRTQGCCPAPRLRGRSRGRQPRNHALRAQGHSGSTTPDSKRGAQHRAGAEGAGSRANGSTVLLQTLNYHQSKRDTHQREAPHTKRGPSPAGRCGACRQSGAGGAAPGGGPGRVQQRPASRGSEGRPEWPQPSRRGAAGTTRDKLVLHGLRRCPGTARNN